MEHSVQSHDDRDPSGRRWIHESRTRLERRLRRLARRLRLVESLRFGLWGASGGLALALALALLARLLPLTTAPVLAAVGLGLALVGALSGGAAAWLRRRPLSHVARLTDRRLGLWARLGTAWAIVDGSLPVAEAPDVAPAQLADALSLAERLDPRAAFPLRLPRREGAVALALALALLPALLLPNPQEGVLVHRAVVRQAVAEQAAALERLQAELTQLESLSETEAGRQVLAELEELRQALAEGDLTQEEAVAALAEAESNLRRLQDEGAAARQAALREAGRRIGPPGAQTAATAPRQALAQALARGDADLAAQILADLADEEGKALSREEELALAEALEQAAESLAASDPDLAENLAQAARSIRQEDVGAARQALAQASGRMAQAGREMQAQQAARRAAERLRQSRRAVARVGQAGQADQADAGQGGQDGRAGQGQQGGQGAGAGAGSGRGDPGAAGAAGAAGGQTPTDNGPNQGLERPYEPIYVPRFLGGEGGEQVFLPGSGEPGEGVRPLPGWGGAPGEALVPYNAVYVVYRDAAAQALDEGAIPLGMKEVVRQYFSSLEP